MLPGGFQTGYLLRVVLICNGDRPLIFSKYDKGHQWTIFVLGGFRFI